MTEMTTMKVCEKRVTDLAGQEQSNVSPLTARNAHRVTMIQEKGTDHSPVPFHFRMRHLGMHNYAHLYGNPESNTELRPAEFSNWNVVEFKHPGYLEDMWEQACDAYRWTSFDSDIRGESDIMIYESELHGDLMLMPETMREGYAASYKQKLSAKFSALSRCANPMVTGRGGFDYGRHVKAEKAYQGRYEEFRGWREKTLRSIERAKQAARPEEEKQEEVWQRLKRDIASSANTIHEIDTGKARGYSRALFVSNIIGKVTTFANHGEVEIVRKAVDFITEYNASVKKPVITARNRFFQLPETAEQMRDRLQVTKSQESKKMEFEGGKLVWNYTEDRLQILFHDIPEEGRRKELKSSGFRWSPKNKAWQRKLTQSALYAAKRVLNLQSI